MFAVTITRTESFDPLYVIEQATRQAVAQQIAREHADPHDPEALTFCYEKDANSEGDYVDLVISGTDETRVGLVLRRLRAHGYDDLTVEWLADEDPPHLISVVSSEAGLPRPLLGLARSWRPAACTSPSSPTPNKAPTRPSSPSSSPTRNR